MIRRLVAAIGILTSLFPAPALAEDYRYLMTNTYGSDFYVDVDSYMSSGSIFGVMVMYQTPQGDTGILATVVDCSDMTYKLADGGVITSVGSTTRLGETEWRRIPSTAYADQLASLYCR